VTLATPTPRMRYIPDAACYRGFVTLVTPTPRMRYIAEAARRQRFATLVTHVTHALQALRNPSWQAVSEMSQKMSHMSQKMSHSVPVEAFRVFFRFV